MTRVKKGVNANKKRRKILKATKGFKWGRHSKERAAREALLHGMSRAFKGRKEKKRTMRTLWNVKVNAGAREQGMKYSVLINRLKKRNIKINRKMLAELAEHEPKVFEKIMNAVK